MLDNGDPHEPNAPGKTWACCSRAEIFGGGVNAFSRYENGKTKPPLAVVKLLKVLDRHPDLLEEIKVA